MLHEFCLFEAIVDLFFHLLVIEVFNAGAGEDDEINILSDFGSGETEDFAEAAFDTVAFGGFFRDFIGDDDCEAGVV